MSNVVCEVEQKILSRIQGITSPRGLDGFAFQVQVQVWIAFRTHPHLRRVTLYLDTKTDVSLLPSGMAGMDIDCERPFSRVIRIDTVAGPDTGRGRMAKAVGVKFPGLARLYRFDFFLAEGFDKEYGLLSLREPPKRLPFVGSCRTLFGLDPLERTDGAQDVAGLGLVAGSDRQRRLPLRAGSRLQQCCDL